MCHTADLEDGESPAADTVATSSTRHSKCFKCRKISASCTVSANGKLSLHVIIFEKIAAEVHLLSSAFHQTRYLIGGRFVLNRW